MLTQLEKAASDYIQQQPRPISISEFQEYLKGKARYPRREAREIAQKLREVGLIRFNEDWNIVGRQPTDMFTEMVKDICWD